MLALNRAALVGVAFAVWAGPGAAASLSENKTVTDGLIAVGVADEIRKRCPDISARMVRAVSLIKSLERHARAKGFSDAEIKAYTKNKEEKARLKGQARAYLAERGATSNPDAYCKVGRDEIAAKSQIGSLLRGN